MNSISAAHPTMPLPSYARVTNLNNSKSIIVRVNDRGPYARDRIIDVSIGTAKALGFYGSGVAPVRVEYVGRAPIEGSDDTMLMATLREGNPAPAPSRIMVASAKPFLSGHVQSRAREPEPAEADANASIGSASPQLVLQSPDPPARAQARSAVTAAELRPPGHRPAQDRASRARAQPRSTDPIGGLIRSDPGARPDERRAVFIDRTGPAAAGPNSVGNFSPPSTAVRRCRVRGIDFASLALLMQMRGG